MFPDIDVAGFRCGIYYGDFWGHRGFTHSLVFAALLAGIGVLAALRAEIGMSKWSLGVYLLLATTSHGVLDAMTNDGLGVAFFSPFDNNRYFFSWRPILVSPISASRFFSGRGYAILQNEFLWIWLPSIVFAAVVFTRPARGMEFPHELHQLVKTLYPGTYMACVIPPPCPVYNPVCSTLP